MLLDTAFSQDLQAFTRRVARWEQVLETARSDPEQAAANMRLALKDLHLAEEELRQQNDELVQAQTLLERERERYRDLFEFAPDAYCVTDAVGVVLEANVAAGRLLEATPRYLAGRSVLTFVHEVDVSEAVRQMVNLGHSHRASEWTARMARRRAGPFFADISITAIAAHYGCETTLAGIRWLLRDGTARVRTEARAEALQAEVLQLKAWIARAQREAEKRD